MVEIVDTFSELQNRKIYSLLHSLATVVVRIVVDSVVVWGAFVVTDSVVDWGAFVVTDSVVVWGAFVVGDAVVVIAELHNT